MAQAPTTEPRSPSPLRQRSPVFEWIARADERLFAVERAIVTTALLLMSGVVCLNILFQFLAAERAAWRMAQSGDGSWFALWPVPVVLVGTLLLTRAAFRASASLRGNDGLVWGLSGLIVLSLVGLSAMMLTLPSAWVCALLALKFGVWTTFAQLDRPRPVGTPLWTPDRIGAMATTVGGTGLAIYASLTVVPEGYTWAQKLALFLLLWIAFIGASMATHTGEHLRVDAIRKTIPARWLPYYNAMSYLVAALFTAAFMWLSWLYLQDRLVETAAPGEIPDWLKVLSIPVALSLVTLRFAGRAVASLLTGVLGLHGEPSEGAS